MEDASLRRHDAQVTPVDILGLDQCDSDIFIDIFTNTYSKIVNLLSKKSKKIQLKQQADALALKTRGLRQMPPIGSNMLGQEPKSTPRRSSTNILVNHEGSARAKNKKMDRAVVGASMMSASSGDERESIKRTTNQSRNSHMPANLFASMDDSMGNTLSNLALQLSNKKDHRKFDKERPKPYLDLTEFLVLMEDSF